MTLRTTLLGSAGTLFYAIGTLVAFVAPRASITIFVALALYYLLPGLFRPAARESV